ncbi:2,4-dienoyl-CoA reductase-like NADH-dependent reductase (Old Yellow Enzyme family)/thioredoxin reductase [Clostridium tetanomorphum]|uniref:FAD-dependent oxidoreductase n=1 Tax=Clostridium tetanomorphum TaxID=1553 RepID=A0A923EET7_CLOTT|nr:NAD(P)/FAD-dependent oxidoreductase [Clostridium tetanomorphum]KAJ50540.1 NADH:flavin oxidoreductase [Clostridium tetanomorphum DSM 665]MBC2399860.1 FAD-dependent oxidoreductase [Clostridium tetanomorphum]MBP1866333.1 2,4-dienoyl-CoA reductase-like NADH-dependent reductase (Old Yellow Enzyme family)/thioredoxin reductase [Clostridium tetanomorphum]NRS83227.1 2,4-dienoyl-CoA reductase-like NADH-dependent reductase (Old Yellow Enzyme family)/thioredoxin reductase [Clostridium tetanomorphum]NR
MKYEKLFSKGHIGNLQIKNRIVMPAMGTSLATSTGEASDEIIKYYEERAKGGCGLIITEITRIDNETGIGTPNQLCATDLKHIPRLEKLAKVVHRYDTKIFLQLHHPGRQNHSNLIGGKQITAPSPVMSSSIGEMPRELTTDEVESLVKKFVFGAYIAKAAGIDGVELHAAHGYLLGQFMSPLTNLRKDKYGGNFQNRMRFITEIIMGIKHICGPNFPISVRVDGDEFVPGGFNLDDAIESSKYFEKLGVDALNVSSGTYESVNTIIEPISYPQGWKRHLAEKIKNAVHIPIIACNVIRKPDFAESLIKEGSVDFVATGRQFLADPEWPKKAIEGREMEIRPCISCLYCIQELMECKTSKCAVNARMGRELEFDNFKKDGNGRIVSIIGGGPAGMEAARVLAIRGFKSVLFEKKNVLGGSVYLGSKPPLKEKLNWFIDNLAYQLKQLNVDIRLNTEPTVEDLIKLNPYAVFVATGASPIIPNIKGVEGKNVYTVIDILDGTIVLKDKDIAIIGSGMTGLEIAEYLSVGKNKVSVVEMQNKIGPDAYLPNLIDLTTRLKKYNVEMLPSMKLIKISEGEILLQNTSDNSTLRKKTDAVVLSIGVKQNTSFIEKIEKNFSIVHVLGDANKPGRIAQAIETGFEKAYFLE